MDQALLEDLVKKDEDFRIIDEHTVFTHLDIGEELEREEEEEEAPLLLLLPSIPSRIARHIFTIAGALAFLYSIFGLVPYYLLARTLPFYLSLTLFVTSLVLFVVAGSLAYCYRGDERAALPLSVMWAILGFSSLCLGAVVLGNLAPFEGCVILFMEYTIALLYCLLAPKEEGPNPYWVAFLMLFSGICVWLLGIYMHDWVSWAILGALCLLVAPLYTAYEVREMNRYSLLERDLRRAPIEFYTDWITVWTRLRVRRPPPPSQSPSED